LRKGVFAFNWWRALTGATYRDSEFKMEQPLSQGKNSCGVSWNLRKLC
jgi:hypothetical protein